MILAVLQVMWLNLIRDRGALAMATVLPPVIFVIFAAIFSGTSGDDLQLRVAWVDLVNDDDTARLYERLAEDETLRLEAHTGTTGLDDVRDLVRAGSVDAAIVLRGTLHDVEDGVPPILVIADDSRAIAGPMVAGRVQDAIGTGLPDVELSRTLAVVERMLGGFSAEQEQRLEAARAGASEGGGGTVGMESMPGQGGAVGGVNYYAGAVAMLFLLFASMQGAASVIEERQSGIVDRLLMGPGGHYVILAGKWLFLTLQGLLQVSLIFLVAWLGYGVDLFGNFGPWLLTTMMAAAAAGGLALALTAACGTRQQAQTISSFAVLLLSAIGGSMVPRFLMPGWLQDLGWITPNAWGIEAYQGIFWRGDTMVELAPYWGVLLGIALISFMSALVLAGRWSRT